MAAIPVTVRLLDREFLVSCTEDERAGLTAAANLLDQKMRELRGTTRTVGFDRLAVLAALSLTHELVQLRERHAERERELGHSLGLLRRKLEAVLPAER